MHEWMMNGLIPSVHEWKSFFLSIKSNMNPACNNMHASVNSKKSICMKGIPTFHHGLYSPQRHGQESTCTKGKSAHACKNIYMYDSCWGLAHAQTFTPMHHAHEACNSPNFSVHGKTLRIMWITEAACTSIHIHIVLYTCIFICNMNASCMHVMIYYLSKPCMNIYIYIL